MAWSLYILRSFYHVSHLNDVFPPQSNLSVLFRRSNYKSEFYSSIIQVSCIKVGGNKPQGSVMHCQQRDINFFAIYYVFHAFRR